MFLPLYLFCFVLFLHKVNLSKVNTILVNINRLHSLSCYMYCCYLETVCSEVNSGHMSPKHTLCSLGKSPSRAQPLCTGGEGDGCLLGAGHRNNHCRVAHGKGCSCEVPALLPSPLPLPESCGFLGHKKSVTDGDLNRKGVKKSGSSQAGGMGAP